MRKSIFDIVAESYDVTEEVERIHTMALKEKTLYANYTNYSLFDFVDEYCFKTWAHRGHCVDVKDYLETVGYIELLNDANSENTDAFFTLIELVYNFWMLAKAKFQDSKLALKWQGNFYHLQDVMDENLQRFNHIAYKDTKTDRVLVFEDKPGVTAAAEIVPETLSLDIIRYNHRALAGEIEVKKTILLALASDLEPKRAELTKINKQLADDIFFMLNNVDIRHNNRSKKDKNYKEYIAKMRKDRLEKWYDELYQMILLAYLLLDNESRTEQVKELKSKIIGSV